MSPDNEFYEALDKLLASEVAADFLAKNAGMVDQERYADKLSSKYQTIFMGLGAESHADGEDLQQRLENRLMFFPFSKITEISRKHYDEQQMEQMAKVRENLPWKIS